MARRVRFDKLVEAWEPRLRKAFLDAVYTIRGNAQLDQIARRIEAGDIEGAIRAVGLNPASFRAFDVALSGAFEAGGNATASAMPILLSADGLRTVFQFDVRNPVAEDWLTNESSTKIREIIADQRAMIRDTLADAMSKGINPRTAALDLVGRINVSTGRREGGMIGLTQSQAAWVRNYEAELRSENPLAALTRTLRDKRFDAAVIRAAKAEEPISETLIGRMVTAYENRALRMRGEAIGRTEALRSLHVAQDQALQQAIEQGLDPQTVRRVWRATHDERTRDSHAEMDGQTRGMDEPFETGDGVLLDFPGDPSGPPEETINCRCWVELLTDFLANIE